MRCRAQRDHGIHRAGGNAGGLRAGRILALANKESLVVGGPLVTQAAQPGQIVAVDSEHSALAQCLRGGAAAEVDRLILTASGGPFRGLTRDQMRNVTPDQALAHPTWNMGRVITTNSATLVNKGLELLEAHLLYGGPGPDRCRRTSAIDRALHGAIHRRVHACTVFAARYEASDRACSELAGSAARCGPVVRLEQSIELDFRAAGQRGLSRR